MNIVDRIERILPFTDSEMRFGDLSILKHEDLLVARIRSDSIYASGLDRIPNVDLIIFASRHSSSSGRSSLTVHAPGNPLAEAKYGGRPQSLAISAPDKMRSSLSALRSGTLERGIPYHVSLEATHHGPTEMDVPVMFIEIGSSQINWKDKLAGEVVAEAILHAVKDDSHIRSAIAFGGGHYAPKFTSLVLEGRASIGHIFSKYCIGRLDEAVIVQAFRRTRGCCDLAILDWKGIGSKDRARILEILEKMEVDVSRV